MTVLSKIHVGNIPFDLTPSEIRLLFEKSGKVISVRLITDRETEISRGFGFVTMPVKDALRAIQALDGFQCGKRKLRVQLAS